jgi:hypothetical protein
MWKKLRTIGGAVGSSRSSAASFWAIGTDGPTKMARALGICKMRANAFRLVSQLSKSPVWAATLNAALAYRFALALAGTVSELARRLVARWGPGTAAPDHAASWRRARLA